MFLYTKLLGVISNTSLSQLQNYFEEIWELPCNVKIEYTKNTEKLTEAKKFLQTNYQQLKKIHPYIFEKSNYMDVTIPTNNITLITNSPEPINKEPELWYMMHQLMQESENVIIQTPYIVCSRDMYNDLDELCNNSNLEIITNSVESGANPWGSTDYLNQKKKILNTGASVFEYTSDKSSHTKTILIDDRISIIGSYNLDMRSTYLDTEMMLVIDCKELNSSLNISADRE